MKYVMRIYNVILSSLAGVAGLLIFACVIGVTADVFARYVFGRSIPWVFELTEYALLYVPFLGMAWLARDKGHVVVDIVSAYLPKRLDQIAEITVGLFVVVICAFSAYWGVLTTVDAYQRGMLIEKVLSVPRWVILIVIPIGFLLTAIEFFRQSLHNALIIGRSAIIDNSSNSGVDRE